LPKSVPCQYVQKKTTAVKELLVIKIIHTTKKISAHASILRTILAALRMLTTATTAKIWTTEADQNVQVQVRK